MGVIIPYSNWNKVQGSAGAQRNHRKIAGSHAGSRLPAAMALPDSRHVPPSATCGTVVELLRPGSFVRLRNQPADLPPFQLIQCRGGRCWVRQQAWGCLVQWEVAHQHLTSAAA
jgi:hypothetical protein